MRGWAGNIPLITLSFCVNQELAIVDERQIAPKKAGVVTAAAIGEILRVTHYHLGKPSRTRSESFISQ